MRRAPNPRVEPHRSDGPRDTNYGVFVLTWRGCQLTTIAAAGGGWDHVSVSAASMPTWAQMCHVKHLFFNDDEVVMQLHPATENYVNDHPRCLHLWRPQTAAEIQAERERWGADVWPYGDVAPGVIPLPPVEFVGVRNVERSEP